MKKMPCTTVNGIELNDTRYNGNGRNGLQQQTEPKTVTQNIKNVFRNITVEPFLLCYIIPIALSAGSVIKFNTYKACRVDLNYTEEICNKVIGGESDDNITANALTEAQFLVANMTAWQELLRIVIPAIVMLFIGAWSDRTGNRKALMLIPIVGEIISALGLLLATYFFLEWPLWVTALIESLPTAFSGGMSVAIMGAYTYVADVTTIEERTFRIGIVGVIVNLGISLVTFISGVLQECIGYYGLFGIMAVMNIFGFLYICVTVRDVRRVPTEGKLFKELKLLFNPSNALASLFLLLLSPKKKLIKIWLIVFAHMIVLGPVFGTAQVHILYVLEKYGMDDVDYIFFLTCSILVSSAGSAISVTVFSKFLGMHDSLLGIIASTSKVLSSFVYGWAPNKLWFYSGPIFDIFGSSGTAVVRSLGTKIVSPEEIGTLASVIGFVEVITPVIYTTISTLIYTHYKTTIPGMFCIVGGIITIPTIVIYIYMYVMHRQQLRDEVKNPDDKEHHAQCCSDVTML